MSKNHKAMIATCRVSLWEGMTTDRKVTGEIVTSKHSSSDAGIWTTRLVPKKTLREVKTKAGILRDTHKTYTLPWLDNGGRILPTKMYMKYMDRIREARHKYNDAVEEFLKEYPSIVEQAQSRLGDLSNNVHFPSSNDLRYKFRVELSVFPLGSADDFRSDIIGPDIKQIKKQMQESFDSVCEKAHKDIYNRLKTMVDKMKEVLSDKDKVFRNTLFTNIQDFTEIMSDLNFKDDPEVENLKKKIQGSILSINPDSVRNNPEVRRTTALCADVISKNIEKNI